MKKFILISTLTLVPMVAFAQLENVDSLIDAIGRLVNTALPIVVGLALLAFFWGLVKYIFAAGNEDAKDEGKRIMIGGIIALFVMVAVWGLVRFIGKALGVQEGVGTPVIPTVPLR